MFCPECGYKNKENATFCFACGSILRNVLGDGRYKIIKFLNRGGMEQLFLARDTKMKTDIVIKQLTPPRDEDENHYEYLKGKMREEARLLYRLNYRGLPRVMDFFPEHGSFFLTMQHINGEDLIGVLNRSPEGRIEIKQCIQWMDRLLDIISFLHGQDPPIIHRDIKPRNIMIDSNGELYLIDFGIACFMKEGRRDYTQIGTYEYASPEHFVGKIDKRSDIYSLGATIYHLLTGLSPSKRAHPGSFPPLKDYLPDAPDKLAKILDKMTAFSKEDRYSNCDEIRQELREDPQIASFLENEESSGKLPSGSKSIEVESPEKIIKTDTIIKEKEKKEEKPETVDMESGEIDHKETEPEKSPGQATGKEIDTEIESGKKKKIPILWIILPFLIVGLGILFFHYRSYFAGSIQKKAGKYKIISISSSREKTEKLKDLAQKNNLSPHMTIKDSYKAEGTIYMVLAQSDSRSLAVLAYASLRKKGYKVVIKENPEEGILVEFLKGFDNIQDAKKIADEINRYFEVDAFYAEAKPKLVSQIVYELEVRNIPTKEEASRLKDEFAPYSDKLKIVLVEEKNSQQEGSYEKNP